MFEQLEQRLSLSDVYEPALLANPQAQAAPSRTMPSAVLEDGTLAYFTSSIDPATFENRTTYWRATQPGQAHVGTVLDPRSGIFGTGAIDRNGRFAFQGFFGTEPLSLDYIGVGVFDGSSGLPATVYYQDSLAPTAQLSASGLAGANQLRLTIDARDSAGQLDPSTLTGSLLRVSESGTVLSAAGTTLDSIGNTRHRQLTVTYNLPPLPAPPAPQSRTWKIELVDKALKDRAGNTAEGKTLGFFVQLPSGSLTWSEPTKPESVPAVPFTLVPFKGSLITSSLGLTGQISFASDGSVIAPGTRLGGTTPEPVLVRLDGGSAVPRSTAAIGLLDVHAVSDSGAMLLSDGDGRLYVAPGFQAATELAFDPQQAGLDPASLKSIAMSSDGQVIVFSATAPEPDAPTGLFAVVNYAGWHFGSLIDRPGDGVLGDSERFVDVDLDGQFTPAGSEDVQLDLPVGDSPVGVLSQLDSSDRFRVVYTAEPGVRVIEASFDPVTSEILAAMPQSVITLGEDRFGTEGVIYGAETPGAAVMLIGGAYGLSLLRQPINSSGRIGSVAVSQDTGDGYLVRADNLGRRPVLLVPGIFATLPPSGGVEDWLMERGVHPFDLLLDPIFDTYTDLLNSFAADGFTRGKDLFAANYDWRLPPAPLHEGPAPADGPWQRTIDGRSTGLSFNSLGLHPTFQHGVDYLVWWMELAKRTWESAHPGVILRSVDVYAHSTGGMVVRSYIQSDLYAASSLLPTVNIFISMAVPHRGASKAWNIIHDNMAADTAYQTFISKIAQAAFRKVIDPKNPRTIAGPTLDLAIDRARLERAVRDYPDMYRTLEEAFINIYIPTGRALLATYPFLFDGGSLGTVNEPGTAWASQRNALALDLNLGLDLGPGNSDPNFMRRLSLGLADPLSFLVGNTSVRAFYTDDYTSPAGSATLMYTEHFVGPRRDAAGRPLLDIYPMQKGFDLTGSDPRAPRAGEDWWIDHDQVGLLPRLGGDGTVPSVSGGDIFQSHPLVRVHLREGVGADHGFLNAEPATQSLVLRELGIPMSEVMVQTGAYDPHTLTALAYMYSLYADPVGVVIVDRLGRRAGWSPETGKLEEIPGSFVYGEREAITFLPPDLAGPVRLIVTGVEPTFAIKLTVPGPEGVPLVYDYSGEIQPGQTLTFTSIQVASPPDPAAAFVSLFGSMLEGGLVRGDAVVQQLLDFVPDAAFGQGYWGGTNYWFQDAIGDVWSLWHGGPVHASTAFPGQHDWLLTNLTDAAGLSGQLGFAPGSLSGIATGWNAFNIQGVADGKLSALWWSPAGSAGQFLDTDGHWKQGLALGQRGNGWVLSSISDGLITPSTEIGLPGSLRAFTESQGNGRTTFDPRPTRAIANDGMSVVVVDTSDQVYVVSFSVSQRPIPEAKPELNFRWVVEPLRLVPSINDFQLGPQIPTFEQQYVLASK